MKKSGLPAKLRERFYTGLTASVIALGALTNYNCGSDSPMEPSPGPGPGNPPPAEVVVNQTAILENLIDIEYTATIKNADEVSRKTLRNGNLIETRTITGPEYSQTMNDMEIGDYMFVAGKDTARVEVLDYVSQAPDLSQYNFNLSGDEPIEVHVERATDTNVEQNPVKNLSVTSLDEKVTASIGAYPNDSILTIQRTPNSVGVYQLEFEFEGNPEKSIIQGEIFETPQPNLSQTLEPYGLIGFVNKVAFENISGPMTRTVLYEGVPQDSLEKILSETTTSPYADTSGTLKKGTWSFVWSNEGITPDTATGSVEDYVPQAVQSFFNNLQADMNEGSQLELDLTGAFTDVNPEDNPVPITSTISLDGKTQPTLNGNQLTIQALGQETGAYEVQVTANQATSEVIQGELFDLPRYQGQIQNAFTNLGEQSEVRAYNGADNSFMAETQTDANGNFDITLDSPVSQVILQARLNSGNNPSDNYVRTGRYTGTDMEDLLISATPYTQTLIDAGVSREDFIAHNAELNRNFSKTNVDSLEFLDTDPLGRGDLDLDFMQLVRERFLDPNDLGCYLPGKTPYVQIDDPSSERHYSIIDGEIVPDSGWAVVTADTTLDTDGFTDRIDGYRFLIRLKNQTQGLATHEPGHGYIAQTGHSLTLTDDQTAMKASGNPTYPSTTKPVDCEVRKVNIQNTYIASESPLNEIYPDIFGLDFLPK